MSGKLKDGEKRKDGKDEKKKKKLKRRDKEGGKERKKKSKSGDMSAADEEEDDCSAVKCLKPSGEIFLQTFANFVIVLTISVRQAGLAAQSAMTLADDRPLDRHANGDRNVKF